MGHDVRLIPPIYVKPYVKRGKNDAADAAAVCDGCNRNSGYPDCHPDRHTCTKGEAWQFPRSEGQVLFIRLLRRILPIGSEPK